jgi:hypothetical protein
MGVTMSIRYRQVKNGLQVKIRGWSSKKIETAITVCAAAFLWLLNKIEGNLDYE